MVQLLDIGFFHSGKNTLCSRMGLVVMIVVMIVVMAIVFMMAVEYYRAFQEKAASTNLATVV